MHDAPLPSASLKTMSVFDRELAVGSRTTLSQDLLDIMQQRPVSALFCNVHMLMLSQEDSTLAEAMVVADRVIPDGVPVAWLQKWMGHATADVLRGYEAVHAICAHAALIGKPVGFLGSTESVLLALTKNLEQAHPKLLVAYTHSPCEITQPNELDPEFAQQLNSLDLFCLFIGLGCPKQEIWAATHAPRLNCSLIAVGAAFDWLAGTTRMPPYWMQEAGLGWAFRFLQNPKRMWLRYLKYNSKFIFASARASLTGKRKQSPPQGIGQ